MRVRVFTESKKYVDLLFCKDLRLYNTALPRHVNGYKHGLNIVTPLAGVFVLYELYR